MNQPTTTIEDLPPEMIGELFKNLPLKDLIACSLVNKRWHSIFNDFKVHDLAVQDMVLVGINKWTFPCSPFLDHELCDLNLFNRFARRPQLSNLNRLALLCDGPVSTNQLIQFSRLQHLEIHTPGPTLNHPNLEVLVIHKRNSDPLTINSPKLRVLAYEEEQDLIRVVHPATIKKLDTDMLAPKLKQFLNVECLVTWDMNAINKATLQSLPSLKKLHFDLDIQDAFSLFSTNQTGSSLARMKRKLNKVLESAQRRAGFEFQFAGFDATEIMANRIEFDVQRVQGQDETVFNESVYLRNFDRIQPNVLTFVRNLNYNLMMRNAAEDQAGHLPAGFFEKFAGLDLVDAGGVIQNEQHFRWFLESARPLVTLYLNGSQLGVDFFGDLAKLHPSLQELHMDALDQAARPVDLTFLKGLQELKTLQIRGVMSTEHVRMFIDLLDDLVSTQVYFEIECENKSVFAEKVRHTREWRLSVEDESSTDFFAKSDFFSRLEGFNAR